MMWDPYMIYGIALVEVLVMKRSYITSSRVIDAYSV